MNNFTAIKDGGLANKPQFFGSGTAEIMAYKPSDQRGAWEGDYGGTVYSNNPWFFVGASSDLIELAGVFAFNRINGAPNGDYSHRTILSGY